MTTKSTGPKSTEPKSSEPKSTAPRRALVFGGGGVLGFAWMLGALSAFEDVTGLDAREADIAVGTSAGSVASALLGCGLPVDAICRHHQGVPGPADPLIQYDYDGTGGALPPRPGWRPGSYRLALAALRHPRKTPPIVALSGLLPAGRGTLEPVHTLIASVAQEAGFADQWPTRPRPWIVAADYRTGKRIVFGRQSVVGTPRQASLADAVTASCSIPAWYAPTVIDGVPYIDGGTISNASVDVLRGTGVEEVYVFAPMASVEIDRARTAVGRVERAVRRAITRGIMADAARLRATGARVCLVTPEPEDLDAMGVNLMNPARRVDVLHTAQVTAARQLQRQLTARAGWTFAGTGAAGFDADADAGAATAHSSA